MTTPSEKQSSSSTMKMLNSNSRNRNNNGESNLPPPTSSNNNNRKQKRMGPAPFASFEDLSDELDSPEDKIAPGSVVRLPGIREDVTPCSPSPSPAKRDNIQPEFVYTGISLIGAPSTPSMTSAPPIPTTPISSPRLGATTVAASLQTPSAPRIDISRASSSSHHDSKESSPERELFAQEQSSGQKLGLGFREEGTLDLRSSTEELDFQGTTKKDDLSHHSHQRKDSQSSEIGLLCISGRTSRLSSIGSQGSAHSRVSNQSRLSVVSGNSGISRSPSPHKMLLETSFCGSKSPVSDAQISVDFDDGTKSVDLESVLLKRAHDPTKALIAEGINMEQVVKPQQTPHLQKLKSDIKITVHKPPPSSSSRTNISTDEDDADIQKPKLPKRIISKSGVEYIYIPLKGPLPPEDPKDTIEKHTSHEARKNGTNTSSKGRVRETKSASLTSNKSLKESVHHHKQKSKSASPSPVVSRHKQDYSQSAASNQEPVYIRIKLKPDHEYEDYTGEPVEPSKPPETLNLRDSIKKPAQSFQQIIQHPEVSSTSTVSSSPKICLGVSKSPSPSLSRKSSFTSIFRSRETISPSPDSPTAAAVRRKSADKERNRSRSKSRERSSACPSSTESVDSKGRQKSMFSLFKSKKSAQKGTNGNRSTPDLPNLENLISHESSSKKRSKSQQPNENPLQSASVRIPLHSPTYYEQKSMLCDFKTSSQDSQDTVIEVATAKPKQSCDEIKKDEDVVFSMKIETGEVFTTKLTPEKSIVDREISEIAQATTTTIILEQQRQSVAHIEEGESDLFAGKDFVQEIMDEVKQHQQTTEIIREEITVIENREMPLPVPTTSKSIEPLVIDDDHNSSESEKDSEFDRKEPAAVAAVSLEHVEPERRGLVLQQDSFEDELPYVPTTLPLERSVAVPIVPIKQRSTFEMKTYSIERPRSTTPIHPTTLEDYCEDVVGGMNSESIGKACEKLRISLPGAEMKSDKKDKSSKSGNMFEFPAKKAASPPAAATQSVCQKEWINFEEIPEKRKPPKRIQTIPSRGHIDVPECVLQENVVYTYVNPEECKCECHERNQSAEEGATEDVREDEMPLLEDDDDEKAPVEKVKLDITILDRRSLVSESSVDLSATTEHVTEANGINHSLQTPFTSDLGISSNRSSIVSQDDTQSPDTESPNAFPKL